MKPNMGTLDRIARLLTAAVIIALYFMNVVTGTVAIALLVFAGILILTSLVSFCPLYLPFGLHTNGDKK